MRKNYQHLASRVSKLLNTKIDPRLRLASIVITAGGADAIKYLTGINLSELRKKNPKPADADPRTFYQELQRQATEGPLFSRRTLDTIRLLPNTFDKVESKWLANQLEKSPRVDLNNLQGILDYSRAEGVQLVDQDYAAVAAGSSKWHKQFAQKMNEKKEVAEPSSNIVLKFPNGAYWAKLTTEEELSREGDAMGHCVGGYCEKVKQGDSVIFSLRDRKGNPHVTLELNREGKVVQIQGKQNDTPVPKYHPYITEFLVKNKIPWTSPTMPYMPLDMMKELSSKDEASARRFTDQPSLSLDGANHLMDLADKNDWYDVYKGLIGNQNAPAEIFPRLTQKALETKGLKVKQKDTSFPPALKHLNDNSEKDPLGVELAIKILGNGNVPGEQVRSIFDSFSNGEGDLHGFDRIVDLTAGNPNTPPDILRGLYDPNKTGLHRSLARNPNTPQELLKELAQSRYPSVSHPVAENPSTSIEILEYLEIGASSDLLSSIAKNTNITDNLARKLLQADNSTYYVEKHLGANKSISEEIMKELSKSDSGREGLVKNPNTPSDILDGIFEHLANIPMGDVEYMQERMLEDLADHPNASEELVASEEEWREELEEFLQEQRDKEMEEQGYGDEDYDYEEDMRAEARFIIKQPSSYIRRVPVVTHKASSRKIRISRLLSVANKTIAPIILNRIKRKRENGIDLSPKEKAILKRIENSDTAPASSVSPNDARTMGKNDPAPMSDKAKKAQKERLKMRKALEKAGVETGKLSTNEMSELYQEIVQRDPLSSDHPVKKTIGSVQKLRSRLRLDLRGLPAALKEMTEAGDEGTKKAAGHLEPMLRGVMGPLKPIMQALSSMEETLTELDEGGWNPTLVRESYKHFVRTEKQLRQYGSQINEVFSPMKNKYEDASRNLTKVLGQRYKEAMKQMREKGATPEQASEGAKSLPIIRKLRSQVALIEGTSGGIEFLMKELGGRFATTMKLIKKLKADFTELARAGGLDSLEKAAKFSTISKRLLKASKRLVLIRYLVATSH